MYIKMKEGELKDNTSKIYEWSDEDLVRNYLWYKMLYKMSDTDNETRFQNRYTVCRIEMQKRGIHKTPTLYFIY